MTNQDVATRRTFMMMSQIKKIRELIRINFKSKYM